MLNFEHAGPTGPHQALIAWRWHRTKPCTSMAKTRVWYSWLRTVEFLRTPGRVFRAPPSLGFCRLSEAKRRVTPGSLLQQSPTGVLNGDHQIDLRYWRHPRGQNTIYKHTSLIRFPKNSIDLVVQTTGVRKCLRVGIPDTCSLRVFL